MRTLLLSLLTLGCVLSTSAQRLRPFRGMVINSSATIEPGIYHIAADSASNQAVITISGDNIVVDFKDVLLTGSPGAAFPDEYQGCAIRIVNGKNITIKNLSIRHYKWGIIARNVNNLVIENCDASYNYRKRLLSNWKREDISDWMSYHHNEEDQWLRYGAAFYLSGCNGALVRHNKVTNGQNALMMTGCNNGVVSGNNFTFNSAIGIGLYYSSHNEIVNNQLDFNVRGYSHGYYWRGQDSAGILVFEQCNGNLFEGNSATHSGDGFFLWAGQTTMDKGTGGSNDNTVIDNDFSYAPTNGIEATFSRNYFLRNKVHGCDHGLWGGYSYESVISNNDFADNRIGIAIEHGRYIGITGNAFRNNKTAIRLWARKAQPDDWLYPKLVDSRSRGYCIADNLFNADSVVYDLTLTDSLRLDFSKKQFKANKTILKRSGEQMVLDTAGKSVCTTDGRLYARQASYRFDSAFVKPDTMAGRHYIRMDEFGPYDYSYPWARLIKADANGLLHLEMNGPKGMRWKLDEHSGINAPADTTGFFGDTILFRHSTADVFAAFKVVNEKGEEWRDGKTLSRFDFRHYQMPPVWQLAMYAYTNIDSMMASVDDSIMPKAKPFLQKQNQPAPDFVWWREVDKGLPADSFMVHASATLQLEEGEYYIGVTADDMVKVFVDGKPVIDAWHKAAVQYDDETHRSARIRLGGKHDIRIVHAEVGGLATLQFYLWPILQP